MISLRPEKAEHFRTRPFVGTSAKSSPYSFRTVHVEQVSLKPVYLATEFNNLSGNGGAFFFQAGDYKCVAHANSLPFREDGGVWYWWQCYIIPPKWRPRRDSNPRPQD